MATNTPDWMTDEKTRARELAGSGRGSVNPDAVIAPPRSLKGLRFRTDYQRRFDLLVATEKHRSGKNGPDLVEEALEMLFKKYSV